MKDKDLTIYLFAITLFGLLAVFSSSAVFSYYEYSSKYGMFIKQGAFALIGWIIFLMIRQLNPVKVIKYFVYPFSLLCIASLVLVLVKGREIYNAKRWLNIAGITLQPSEFFKIAAVMLAATCFEKDGRILLKNPNGSWNPRVIVNLLLIGLGTGLIFLEPDFGSAAMIIVICWLALFASNVKLRYSLSLIPVIAVIGIVFVLISPYRIQRIKALLQKDAKRESISYQIVQSERAIQNGKLLGVGPGKSRQKIFYLPQAWSDFIFSIIYEETGIPGTGLLIFLYVMIYLRIFVIYAGVKDIVLKFYVFMMGWLLVSETLLNISIALGAFFPKGMALPFISAGGSSFIASMLGLSLADAARERNE